MITISGEESSILAFLINDPHGPNVVRFLKLLKRPEIKKFAKQILREARRKGRKWPA